MKIQRFPRGPARVMMLDGRGLRRLDVMGSIRCSMRRLASRSEGEHHKQDNDRHGVLMSGPPETHSNLIIKSRMTTIMSLSVGKGWLLCRLNP